jgi:Tol biopolymer transport system component
MPAARRLALAALCSLPVSFTAGAAGPAGAAPAALPQGTVVFAGTHSGDFGIYSVRADGTRLGQLTHSGAEDSAPLFSPDGRRILFLRGSTSVLIPKLALWVMNADGSGQRRLASYGIDPAWSPDSRRIAYVGVGRSLDDTSLTVVDASGRNRRVVRRHAREPAWSPDGKRLAVATTGPADRTDLAVVGANGRGLRTIRRNIGSGPITWLPTGLISFGTDDGGVYLVRPDGSHARRLRLGQPVSALAWAPDGRRFAFTDFGGGPLHVGSTAGGAVRIVSPKRASRLSQPSWSPDGRWIVVRHVPPGATTDKGDYGDLLVVAADGSSWRETGSPSSFPYRGDSRQPSWRPRGATPARLGAAPAKPSPAETASRSMLRTAGPILGLAGDGSRVAVSVDWSPIDCGHVSVWAPGARLVHAGWQQPCPQDLGAVPLVAGPVALAGTEVAWIESGASPSTETDDILAATTVRPAKVAGVDDAMSCANCSTGDQGTLLSDVYGAGDLLAYGTWTECVPTPPDEGPPDCTPNGEPRGDTSVKDERLWRIRGSRRVLVRSGPGSVEPTDVDAGRILVLEVGGALAVFRPNGSLVHRLALPAGEALSAKLSGSQLVVLTATALQVYNAATGAPAGTFQLARSSRRTLADVDHGVAVYVEGRTVHALRLSDGRQTSFAAPGKGRVFAQLETAGLFTAYTLAGRRPGRIAFLSRAALARRLGGFDIDFSLRSR